MIGDDRNITSALPQRTPACFASDGMKGDDLAALRATAARRLAMSV